MLEECREILAVGQLHHSTKFQPPSTLQASVLFNISERTPTTFFQNNKLVPCFRSVPWLERHLIQNEEGHPLEFLNFGTMPNDSVRARDACRVGETE
jgi:hypothetical protein